ncbi:TraB/GumN family protein [Arenibaculum pallidiluteum]|uniref:hypothetical protein n=1 Tax=Arenibaculum pallidiluteum TaxID=2812559 RepID=UPI001A9790F9|nr:hypothetical protein [Arenibaculum pallidiluteum]
MARPNYVFPFTEAQWKEIHDPAHPKAAAIAASLQDPMIREDAAARKIEIDYYFGDFLNLHRDFRSALKLVTNKTEWLELYGTEAFRREEEERIEASRDALRDVDPPLRDPNANLALPHDCEAEAGVQNILLDNDGVCLGHAHDQANAYGALTSIIDNAAANFGPGGGMVFVEELPAYLQDEIDAYLASNPEAAWLPTTQAFFDTVARARGLKDDQRLDAMLKKAREKNIKVYSIDSGACSPSIGGSASFGEMRTANMNAFGKEVMDKAIRDNPDRKFVVFCGAAHSNTHEGGIPGFSQIYDIPAVAMRNDGTIEPDNEDRSLRGMPSKEEQVFIDRFLAEFDRKAKKNEIPRDEFPDGDELKKLAVAMAGKMKAEGKLPDFSSIENLRKDPSPQAQEQYRTRKAELTAQAKGVADSVPSGRNQRAEAAKEAIRNGDVDRLRDLIELDPDIVLVRSKDPKKAGENLLATATASGARNAANLVREQMLAQIEQRITLGKGVPEEDLAEAVLVKAEQKVWEGVGGTGGDQGLEVNPKKHKELVAKLAADIKALPKDKKTDPARIVDQLSTTLASDPRNGFFKKKPAFLRKADPDHVSIDRKKAAKAWMRALAAL